MIVTMAYDEDLANRIRELIASEDGYTEQKRFGETEALLAKPGARPFEMRGREMKSWLRLMPSRSPRSERSGPRLCGASL